MSRKIQANAADSDCLRYRHQIAYARVPQRPPEHAEYRQCSATDQNHCWQHDPQELHTPSLRVVQSSKPETKDEGGGYNRQIDRDHR
jgi:hypothetical protein